MSSIKSPSVLHSKFTRRRFVEMTALSAAAILTKGCRKESLPIGRFRDIPGIDIGVAIPASEAADGKYSATEFTRKRAKKFAEYNKFIRTQNATKSNRLYNDYEPFEKVCGFVSNLNNNKRGDKYSLIPHSLVWDNQSVLNQTKSPEARPLVSASTPNERKKVLETYVLKALEKVFQCPSVTSVDILNEILLLHGDEIEKGYPGIPLRGSGNGLIPDIKTVAEIYKKANEAYPDKEYILNIANTLYKNYKEADRKREYLLKALQELKDSMGGTKLPTIGLQAHYLMSVEEAFDQLDKRSTENLIKNLQDLGFTKIEISEFDFLSNSLNKSVRFIEKFFETIPKGTIERFCFWGFHTELTDQSWLKSKHEKIYGELSFNIALPGDFITTDEYGPHDGFWGTDREFSGENPLYAAYYRGLQSIAS